MTPYYGEFLRYHALLTGALEQISDADYAHVPAPGSNSISVILKHLAGNFRSRFTNLMTEDGEKPWRNRDQEFVADGVAGSEIRSEFEDAFAFVLETVQGLTDQHRSHEITIRGQGLTVEEALARAVAHFAFHTGEVVYICKMLKGDSWTSLTIPVGASQAYNQNPTKERHTDDR